jgi:hypothetical protein
LPRITTSQYVILFNVLWWFCRGCSPLPIPNREVKPLMADGTAPQCGRVGSCHILLKASSNDEAFLFYIPLQRAPFGPYGAIPPASTIKPWTTAGPPGHHLVSRTPFRSLHPRIITHHKGSPSNYRSRPARRPLSGQPPAFRPQPGHPGPNLDTPAPSSCLRHSHEIPPPLIAKTLAINCSKFFCFVKT